jgi:chromosome segregation ATPase
MIWGYVAIIGVAVGFVIFMVVLVIRARDAAKKARAATVTAEKALTTALGNLQSADQTIRGLEAERARYEKVVNQLRGSIRELEDDLISCKDPAVVKRKLREMLGSP